MEKFLNKYFFQEIKKNILKIKNMKYFLSLLAQLMRFSADFMHLLSKYVLLKKIKETKSCSGISLKTQLLYTIVFIARYIDLFFINITHKIMVYNTIMKFTFIIFQLIIMFFMKFKYSYSYNKKLDKMPLLVLIIPSAVIAVFVQDYRKTFFKKSVEFLYTFSIILEAVAILPQLVQIQTTGDAESLTSAFVLFLGLYRLFYVLSWVFRYFAGIYIHKVNLLAGLAQTLLYIDFFVLYYKFVFSKLKIKIPMSFKRRNLNNFNNS